MKIAIEPIHTVGFNCLENCLISILNWKSVEYEKAFVDSWKFPFLHGSDSTLLGKRFKLTPLKNCLDKYTVYCGVRLNQLDSYSIGDPYYIIKNELSKNMPLILFTDLFYCPWCKEYHKYHNDHLCAITGMDEDNIYCMDTAPIERNAVIPKNEFTDRFHSLITMSFDGKMKSFSSVKSNLKKCVKNSNLSSKKKNIFSLMRECSENFKNINIEKETEGCLDIWNVPIFDAIIKTYGSRYQLKKFIEYLHKYYNDDILTYFYEQFSDITAQWAEIKSMLSKLIIGKQSNLIPRISSKIMEAADMEESTAEDMHNYVKGRNINISRHSVGPVIENNYEFVDLSIIFNNKGFEGKDACFSRSGQYFFAKGLPDAAVLTADGMEFKFSPTSESKYDNISCKGQTVKLPQGTFSKIMLLYCAEWGSFIENIIVNYTDNTYETVELAASDWYGEPEFQDTVAWTGDVTADTPGFTEKGSIYARTLNINANKKTADSIVLPDCANIHIFSITLA